MRMKLMAGVAVAMALMVSACGGPVDDDKVSDFVAKASVANLFEIETSQLALERASHPDVKGLAQQIITDHTTAGENLKRALSEAKSTLAPATALDEKHQTLYNDLRDAPPEEFDDKYIDIQAMAHDEAIGLFKDYADGGTEGPVKLFARDTLPTLEAHKAHVTSIDDRTHAGETHSETGSEAASPSAMP